MEGKNLRKHGSFFEKKTAEKYEKEGYRILEMNYYSKFGEIDIIASKGETIAFVEVKARDEQTMTSPFEAITPVKQKRIIKSAKAYLAHKGIHGKFVRFDAAGVYTENGILSSIEIIQDAFQC